MNRPTVVLLALACSLVAAPAYSAVHCVADAAEFQAALSASASNGEDDEIRLEAGIYLPNARLTHVGLENFDLLVEGGWSPGCMSRREDPALTVIDGSASSDGIAVWTFAGTSAAALTVRGLSFTSTTVGTVNAVSLGSYSSSWSGDLQVENVVFRDIAVAGTADYAVAIEGGAGNVTVRNNVFIGNRIDRNYREPQRLTSRNTTSMPAGVFSGNTVTGNAAEAGSIGSSGALSIQGVGRWELVNNLLWGNAGADLKSSVAISLISNDIGVQQLGTVVESRDNLSINPRLGADGRLSADSPLIDIGEPAPTGGVTDRDAFGQPRLNGLTLDIGAFETQGVFRDGFDAG